MPLAAVQTRKMPATMPVASTDRVSMKTQNVMANQTVKFDHRHDQDVDQQVQERAVAGLRQIQDRCLRPAHAATSP